MSGVDRSQGVSASYWIGLLCAILLTAVAMRYREAPTAACVATPQSTAITTTSSGRVIADYRITFNQPADGRAPVALTIGQALPFYRLTLNGADITPGVDLAMRNQRDTAPHRHVLPAELLLARGNILSIHLPQSATLGPVSVEQVCVGTLAEMKSAFRANWWRMVGIPGACALLFVALALLAVALWLLSGRQVVYLWYVACLLPLLTSSLYLATSARPGGAMLWLYVAGLCFTLLPLALHGFMRAHWNFKSTRLLPVLGALTAILWLMIGVQAFGLFAGHEVLLNALFVIAVVASSAGVVGSVLLRVGSMHRVERRVLFGIGLFALVVALLDVANVFLPFAQRRMWMSPIAAIVLALGFGYLLIRRMAIGRYVHAFAADTLAGDLDQAITSEPLPSRHVWSNFSAVIGRRERSRLMRDIHDGFGSRLVGLLVQARRELAQSPLLTDIHRALLDMRLMIDAMDESCSLLDNAMARFRHRIEQSNATAASRCEWRFGAADDVVIGDRARLIAVYRGLEELLNEALQTDASRLVVDMHASRHVVRFGVEGGKGWSESALGRIRHLVKSAGGDLVLQLADGTPRCEFSVPMF